MCPDAGEVTLLLKAMQSGDPTASEKLLPLVYEELHRLAKSYMRRERGDHTLQPTALINETYLRLIGDTTNFQNRAHFIGFAAQVMRHVLVDHARAHNAAMRGGNLRRVELDEGVAISKERSGEILALDEALNELEKVSPRQAKVVEIASMLEIGPRSVEREWASARVWLFERMR
jgi:RNA polymerase sigma-70 factor (ECF subfamily)